MKKYKNEILAVLIPIFVLLVALLFNGFYPFGNKILLMLDGYNQYPGFLNSFKEIIFGNQSLFYSFKGLTGFNLYATSIYYSFNITNLFFLLFKTSNIVNYYTIIIILKMSLCSLSMLTFLNYINKKSYNFLFSICYALSAYNILYYLNYMWFDSVIMLPLVILGIEKIFKENKYYYYTITLTLAIIFNFYIGYMICIFSALYFIYKFIINKANKEKLFKYLLYSLFAGCMSSFTLIPVVIELLESKGEIFATTNYFKFDLDFINALYKLTLGSLLNGDLEYGNPNVYVSMFVYLNVVLYFFNKKIKLKEKILSLCLLIFFLFSMSFNLLDYFWQMLQMPIYYPVRYAFIFDFYLIYLAFKNYTTYEKISLIKNAVVFIIIILLSSIGFITSGNLIEKINIPAKLIYLGISFLFLIYYLFMVNNKDFKKYIFIVLIIELSVNTFVTFRNNGNINDINTFNNTYNMNYNVLKSLKLNTFERVSFADKTIKNNGLLLNYNDLNYFSSVRNNKTFNALNKVYGIFTIDGCNLSYDYNNPIVNALLSVKYYITEDNLNMYELINTYNTYNIYENKDITSIGFMINNKITDFTIKDNYVDNINNLTKIINNNDKDIIKEIESIDKSVSCSTRTCITYGDERYIKYEYTALDNEIMFVQYNYQYSDKTVYNLVFNDKDINYNIEYPIKLKKNDKVLLTINPPDTFKDYDYHFYIIDYNVYKDFVKNINNNKLEITNYKSDSNFTGKINVTNDGILYTNISNDKGWTIKVDGKKVKIIPLLDGFIGLNLNKGEHTIEFNYTPPGLKEGLIISSISLLTFVLLTIKKKKVS